jgi:hypothetical protein
LLYTVASVGPYYGIMPVDAAPKMRGSLRDDPSEIGAARAESGRIINIPLKLTDTISNSGKILISFLQDLLNVFLIHSAKADVRHHSSKVK